MTHTPDREYVMEAVQEKLRGGWSPESIPGHNGNEEGTRAIEALEANAVTKYLNSDQAREHLAQALAGRRLQATSPVGELESTEFYGAEAESILSALLR